MTQTPFIAQVKKKWLIADNCYGFEFVGMDGAPLPPFEAGAHVDIIAAPGVTRQYSIANDPAEPDRYVLGILKTENPNGVSTALCDRVQEGAFLKLGGPRNHFPLVEDADFTHLIGGGIGITPLLAMAHRLHALQKPFKVHFFARNAAAAPFHGELANLPFADQVQTYFDDSNGDPRISLGQILFGLNDTDHLYTCGPSGFMNTVIDMASKLLPEDQVHKEFFEFQEEKVENSDFEVEIKSTGQILTVPADRPVIDVLQENGVFVPRNCPKGVCGACARQVLEGDIDHRDHVLPPQAREMGYMLLCVSRAKSERLVLDL